MIAAIFASLLVIQCDEPDPLPDALVGRWVTEEPKYADRFFELTKNVVVFGKGYEYLDIRRIRRVVESQTSGGALYSITYANDKGKEYRFSFYYEPKDGGVIRFKNQMQIKWTKGGNLYEGAPE